MSKLFPVVVALAGLAGLAACANRGNVNLVSSTYADGATHTEPVFYNDKHYSVSFRYVAAVNAYDVTVAGKDGRALAGKAGDQAIVENIAASTIRHFACARGQKSAVVPGSTRHDGQQWAMQTRCA